MELGKFAFVLVGVLLTLLPATSEGSPLPDVTVPRSQSEQTFDVTKPSPARQKIIVSAVGSPDMSDEAEAQPRASEVVVDTDSGRVDLLSEGQANLHLMQLTIVQTNVTFRQLTSLQAVYNVTCQYTHILDVIVTTTRCETCDDRISCADADEMTSDWQEDEARYCRVRNLVEKWQLLQGNLATMMKSMHGTTPACNPVTVSSPADQTNDVMFHMQVIAEAGRQLAEAKNLMEQEVVGQL